MLLSYENIAHYLLEKGLVSLDSIVEGAFSVRDQSSRNANFAVNREYTPGYLVKQVRAQDAEKKETLRIEATCYWLANNDPAYQALRAFLPRYFEYDYLHHVLVLELLPEVENLHEHYLAKGHYPILIAEQFAELLASYHTHIPGQLEGQKSFSLFKKRKPWVFTLNEESLADWLKNPAMGAAEKQTLELILGNQDFMHHLRSMGEAWEMTSLIHGDVKFPNFLINKDFVPGNQPDIRLIDWELADIGDPLWDVAAVIQNYLTLWVASEINPKNNPRAYPVSLEQLQPSISAFWQRYCERAGWQGTIAQQQLEKTLRYTALKLVHTCFESVQGVKDMHLYSAKILQLSLNLLNRPDEAVEEILGIQTHAQSHAATLLS